MLCLESLHNQLHVFSKQHAINPEEPSFPPRRPVSGGRRGNVVQHGRRRPGGWRGGCTSLRQDEDGGGPHGTNKQIHGEKKM